MIVSTDTEINKKISLENFKNDSSLSTEMLSIHITKSNVQQNIDCECKHIMSYAIRPRLFGLKIGTETIYYL